MISAHAWRLSGRGLPDLESVALAARLAARAGGAGRMDDVAIGKHAGFIETVADLSRSDCEQNLPLTVLRSPR